MQFIDLLKILWKSSSPNKLHLLKVFESQDCSDKLQNCAQTDEIAAEHWYITDVHLAGDSLNSQWCLTRTSQSMLRWVCLSSVSSYDDIICSLIHLWDTALCTILYSFLLKNSQNWSERQYEHFWFSSNASWLSSHDMKAISSVTLFTLSFVKLMLQQHFTCLL